MTFDNFDFNEQLSHAIKEAGFKEPSPIQAEAIPMILNGDDLIAQAHTGTGKTAAFALPILQKLCSSKKTEALVIVPTRELAMQVSDEIYRFGKFLDIKTATVYGGSSYTRQIEHVRHASVIVATPGRLIDLLGRGKITINPLFVVLDEADEMLDMGFHEAIKEIFSFLPQKRQTLMFSATMSKEIKKLAQRILNEPKTVSITQGEVTNTNIRQLFYVVDEHERDDALVRLLDYKTPAKSIIFCRMKKEVDRLRDFLNAQGYSTKGLHGDMDQRRREETIRHFKKGGLEILIATDVAARGLDVNDVSHVFNYHLPFDSESYVHRIGRTGRAGREGTAISIVSPHEFKALQRIRKNVGSQMQSRIVPRLEDVQNRQNSELLERIREQEIEPSVYDAIEKLKEEFDLNSVACKLMSMIQKNEKIKGADRIGKDAEEIKQLFAQLKNENFSGGRRSRRNHRHRNSRPASGTQRSRRRRR